MSWPCWITLDVYPHAPPSRREERVAGHHRRSVFRSQAVWALSAPVDVFAEWMDDLSFLDTQRANQSVLASLKT